MNHPSNSDFAKLQDLILEFDKIIFRLEPTSPIHTNLNTTLDKIKDDVGSLQNFLNGQAKIICSLTSSAYLKGLVNSVLDSASVDETLTVLKKNDFGWA